MSHKFRLEKVTTMLHIKLNHFEQKEERKRKPIEEIIFDQFYSPIS